MSRNVIVLIVTSLALVSCATMVSEHPSNGPYGPEGVSKGSSGAVAYNPNGLPELVDMRRKDAFRKIYEFCGSRDYKVVKEETVETKDAGVSNGRLATIGAPEVRRIDFQCN